MTAREGVSEQTGLLPCPFCGGEPRMVVGPPGCTFIMCRDCKATSNDVQKERAIVLWNTRTHPPASEQTGAVAWVVQLKYGEDHWSGEMLTDVLPSDTSTYRVLRPLYAHPPVPIGGATQIGLNPTQNGYSLADALAETETSDYADLVDNANIGKALMVEIYKNVPNWSWMECPSEVVCHLLNEAAEPNLPTGMVMVPIKTLRLFTEYACYPVAKSINARGYEWRDEGALDFAKQELDAILSSSPSQKVGAEKM